MKFSQVIGYDSVHEWWYRELNTWYYHWNKERLIHWLTAATVGNSLVFNEQTKNTPDLLHPFCLYTCVPFVLWLPWPYGECVATAEELIFPQNKVDIRVCYRVPFLPQCV